MKKIIRPINTWWDKGLKYLVYGFIIGVIIGMAIKIIENLF